MKLYLQVTKDKYELPVAISDTPAGLARICGVSKNTVLSAISHAKERKRGSIYRRVEVPDDEELSSVSDIQQKI